MFAWISNEISKLAKDIRISRHFFLKSQMPHVIVRETEVRRDKMTCSRLQRVQGGGWT